MQHNNPPSLLEMASYYPEGECYFVRSSLKYAGNNWTAQDKNQFYSHVLLEYNWNGWREKNTTTKAHIRSQWESGTAPWWKTRFGDWDKFFVGESKDRNPDNMLAVHSHCNSLNWNECRDLDSGGPRKYILRPVAIHHKDTQWLWIDATIPLRAIYFPVAQTTDQAFQNLCTYVVIDFRHRSELEISNLRGKFKKISVTPQSGLGWRDDLTWGFKVPDIIAFLTIPHKLRNPDQGLFKAKVRGDELVVCASSARTWNTGKTYQAAAFFREMDVAKVLSATFGVEVGWRPYQYSSFIMKLVLQVVELGLGFIPGAGTILSVAFGIGVQLLQDPTSFRQENVLNLGAAVLDLLLESGGKSEKYLAPGFLPKSAGGGLQKRMALTNEERARRKEEGEEINKRLTEELTSSLVIRSLLEQDLLLHGEASGDDLRVEEAESEATETAADDVPLTKEEAEEDKMHE
ncbi:hypothetical protein C2857_007928 [Epichloe festucae Fl1]|uniref:Uncharacterized protein n=1 Tax=Epichloe festucae (strain Fl1) TaxID=877507 RepID=A0A7S9KMX6_EPIFF|nr:hypothetical protein C2857_007928 [Epichloe festucae Fl1]